MDQRILIIEDDRQSADAVAEVARELELTVSYSRDGSEGLSLAADEAFSLVILDLGLPKVDGFDVCRMLREKKPNLPIIIVSSRALEGDKVIGLELGADDYLVKPFGPHELRARIRAVLRRSQRVSDLPREMAAGSIQVNTEGRTVTIEGKLIQLTALEFDLLAQFVASPNRVFTRDDLMRSVWGFDASSFGPSITAQISRLRNKIEPDPARPRYLLTVRGVGYRLAG